MTRYGPFIDAHVVSIVNASEYTTLRLDLRRLGGGVFSQAESTCRDCEGECCRAETRERLYS